MSASEHQSASVEFAPLAPICIDPLAFGTAWLVSGDAGIGKSVFGVHFAVQGLRRGESVVYIAADESPDRLRVNCDHFGLPLRTYEREGRIALVDAFTETCDEEFCVRDRSDPEELIFVIGEAMTARPGPSRVVLDSVTSVAAYLGREELTWFVYEKNRVLKRSDSVHVDLYLSQTLEGALYCLINAYDVSICLEFTEVQGGFPRRRLRVTKVRGGNFDPRPYPFDIAPYQGIVVETDYYRRELDPRGRSDA